MALIPLGTLSINQAAKIITFTNTTGAYNVTTNPTGYGSPNRTTANTITDFVITKPDGTTVTIRNNQALSDPTQAAVPTVVPYASLTKTFTPTDLEYDTSYITFPDGIYKFECWTWYRISDVGEIASDVLVTLAGGTFSSITAGFGDTNWVKVIGTSAQENNRYATVVNDTTLSVSEAWSSDFPGAEPVSIYAGYLTTVYLKVINGLLTCIQPKMAKVSITEQSCCKQCCTEDLDKYMEIFYGIFSVDAQFKVGLYDQANANIAALNKICSSEDCNCSDKC